MSASLAPECNDVKEKYDSCFLKWYSEKFLRGDSTSNDCDKVFEQYKKCLSKALKERGVDAMVEEARAGSKEHDAENMKRRPCMLSVWRLVGRWTSVDADTLQNGPKDRLRAYPEANFFDQVVHARISQRESNNIPGRLP